MELINLRTFVAVVEDGGVKAAANRLNTVQSNVTSRLQKLQEECGAELFHKQGRKLVLAPGGRLLLDYAQRILSLEQQAKRALTELGDGSGDLRIGAMETFASLLLPPALQQIRLRHPGIALHVDADTSASLLQKVLNHKLDCAFVGGPVSHPDIQCDFIREEELVLIRGRGTSGRDNNTLILFREGCTYRRRALAWRELQDNGDSEVMELGTLDGILGCIASGLGCTLMPRWIAEQSRYADAFEIETVAPELMSVPTLMIRRKDGAEFAALKSLKDALM
jgi:DNA-binding transcriptional LysR family regulator